MVYDRGGIKPYGENTIMAIIVGNNGNNNLNGTGRNDTILGRGGRDDIEGRGGNDYIDPGNGRDKVDAGNGRDTILVDKADDWIDGGNGRDTALLQGSGLFDLRGELESIETIRQFGGNAELKLNDNLFETVNGGKLEIDLGGGNHDTVNIFYDGDDLDFDLVGDKIKFGKAGEDLDKELVLTNVEHLNFFNTDTGAHGSYDHWIA